MGSTRETLGYNPGRETVHADPKTGEPEVFLEPLLWGLFSLGGFITAFLFHITVFLLFLAPVFGLWPSDPAAYVTFAAHWREPLVRLLFFSLLGGTLVHWDHRLQVLLADPGRRGRRIEVGAQHLFEGARSRGTLRRPFDAARA